MNKSLDEFNKSKEFLICIDSDGCAMDTMDIKHTKCFGPCMIEEWKLNKWQDSILNKWNEVNLYTMTRGINRFKGLALALVDINKKYISVDGLDDFLKWVNETGELSNESLENEINKVDSVCLKKALNWSKSVNKSINKLEDSEKKPFEGVLEGIKEAHKIADIAIVSSANEQAVLEEWEKHNLLDDVDIVLTQNIGTKSYCIKKLIEKGYDRKNVLMVGDALGDYDSAKLNDVLYYPILVRYENQSWKRFTDEAIEKLINNDFIGDYQNKVYKEFKENLSNDR